MEQRQVLFGALLVEALKHRGKPHGQTQTDPLDVVLPDVSANHAYLHFPEEGAFPTIW